MHLHSENIFLVGSLLLLLSIPGGKTTSRWGMPTLLFFLLTGILAGSECIGGIPFDDLRLAQFIGITALNFILFSGGLDTNFRTIAPVSNDPILFSYHLPDERGGGRSGRRPMPGNREGNK
jgi:cell volume regulation protein A